jgi:hypothetical protein
MKKVYLVYLALVIGIILVGIGYIKLYPFSKLNEPFAADEHGFISLFWIGYTLMLLYHFFHLRSIYELTKRGFETNYQIIGALFIVFSMFLLVPILILLNQFGASAPLLSLDVQWILLIITYVIQSVILISNMIVLNKIGITD